MPVISWIYFLHELKHGAIEQVYLLGSEDDKSSRIRSTERKSEREERFAAKSWKSLRSTGISGYEIAREYAGVFPASIQAKFPADRGVRTTKLRQWLELAI